VIYNSQFRVSSPLSSGNSEGIHSLDFVYSKDNDEHAMEMYDDYEDEDPDVII
jgi:hypothetical protein